MCYIMWCITEYALLFLLHYCTILCVYHQFAIYLNMLSCVILYWQILCCATPYSTVQVPYSDYMLYGTMECLKFYTIGYITVLHYIVLHYAECGVALFCTVLYFFVWHHYVVYRTVPYTHCAIYYLCHIDLYRPVVYSIVLYSTVLFCSVPNGWQFIFLWCVALCCAILTLQYIGWTGLW
jgi:hypothetical protein